MTRLSDDGLTSPQQQTSRDPEDQALLEKQRFITRQSPSITRPDQASSWSTTSS